MKKSLIITVSVLVIIVIGLVAFSNSKKANDAAQVSNQNEAKSAFTGTIVISNYSFNPSTVTIKKGTTIKWMNTDATAHTVTGDNGGPSSGQLMLNGTYSFTFNNPGIYSYHCSIHTGMKGKIIVN